MKNKKNFGNKIHIFLLTLLAVITSINFFWSKTLVPGFDTPFYLSEISSFLQSFPNPLSYQYLDRYLTIAFPSLLSKLFSLDPIASYRIAITVIYLAISFVLFRLFKNLTKKDSSASLLSAALVISPFMLTYSYMLFANFTGFLILFSFFAIETNSKTKHKEIYLGLILGLIFYIHNFSMVSVGLIIATYYLLKLIFTRNLKVFKEGIIVLLVTAAVGFVGLSRYLNINLQSQSPSQNSVTSTTPVIKVALPVGQPVILGDEKERIVASFKEHSGKFWLLFFPPFATVTLYIARKELRKHKSNFILPLTVFIPSIALTFQPLYHLNFLPERFVSLTYLGSLFLYVAIITLPRYQKYLVFLAAIPLLINYLSSDSLILNKGYRSFSTTEISVYQTANHLLPENSVVFIASDHYYWSRYFLNKQTISPGESFVSCGTVTDVNSYGVVNFTVGRLLGENDSQKADELLVKLKSLYPNQKLFILTDTNVGCGHGRAIKDSKLVKQILKQESWNLYEII